MSDPTNTCKGCGAENWETSATLIKCKACGRTWGRVNGTWVLDPDTVPEVQESPVKIARDHRARVGGSPREGESALAWWTRTSSLFDNLKVAWGTTVAEAGSKPCGLTFDQLTAACRNVGIDLTCGGCAANFFTGTGASSHDEDCKTIRAKQCSACKHWLPFDKADRYGRFPDSGCNSSRGCGDASTRRKLGLCDRVPCDQEHAYADPPAEKDRLALVEDLSGCAGLRTDATFGCILWEKK